MSHITRTFHSATSLLRLVGRFMSHSRTSWATAGRM